MYETVLRFGGFSGYADEKLLKPADGNSVQNEVALHMDIFVAVLENVHKDRSCDTTQVAAERICFRLAAAGLDAVPEEGVVFCDAPD